MGGPHHPGKTPGRTTRRHPARPNGALQFSTFGLLGSLDIHSGVPFRGSSRSGGWPNRDSSGAGRPAYPRRIVPRRAISARAGSISSADRCRRTQAREPGQSRVPGCHPEMMSTETLRGSPGYPWCGAATCRCRGAPAECACPPRRWQSRKQARACGRQPS